MVLEWSRIDLLCCMQCQSTFQGNMGDSEPPGILCESCACIIHTNVQSCMSIIRPDQIDLLFHRSGGLIFHEMQ